MLKYSNINKAIIYTLKWNIFNFFILKSNFYNKNIIKFYYTVINFIIKILKNYFII